MLAVARELLLAGDHAAALVIAWTAIEAQLRDATQAEGIPEALTLRPIPLLKQAFADGLLSRADFASLIVAANARTAVVHGFRPPDTPTTARRALAVAEHLSLEGAAAS